MISVEGLTKTYRTGRVPVKALTDLSFTAPEGQLLAVKGRSGAGKTTLLNILGGLDTPDDGRVVVAGQEVTALGEAALQRMRREVVGFVFQTFALIPVLSAAENIGVPLRLGRAPARQREERVRLLLSLVGLADHADQRPYELSGGQQQRVAIARALAHSPRILFADEPTGQLDSETAQSIMQLVAAIVRDEGVTAVVATHDPLIMGYADRVIELGDGVIVSDTVPDGDTAASSGGLGHGRRP